MPYQEKHPVEVVWADGSRALAHNLDDLRERWRLSFGPEGSVGLDLLEQETPSTSEDIDFTQFDFTSPPSIKHARDWQTIIRNRVGEVEAMLSTARTRNEKGWVMRKDEYLRAKATLVAEKNYLLACGRMVKDYIREWSSIDLQTVLEQVERSGDVSTVFLARSYQVMEGLLRNGAEIPEEGLEIIYSVRDYLQSMGMGLKNPQDLSK